MLVRGKPGWKGAVLRPGHLWYPTFWFAWRDQEQWNALTHERFWRMHLSRWPNLPHTTTSADDVRQIAELRAAGLTWGQVGVRLGREPSKPMKLAAEAMNLPAEDRPVPFRAQGLHAQAELEDAAAAGMGEHVRRVIRQQRVPRVVELVSSDAERGDRDARSWTSGLE